MGFQLFVLAFFPNSTPRLPILFVLCFKCVLENIFWAGFFSRFISGVILARCCLPSPRTSTF